MGTAAVTALCREHVPKTIRKKASTVKKMKESFFVSALIEIIITKLLRKKAAIKTSFQITATVPNMTGILKYNTRKRVALLIFFVNPKTIKKIENKRRNT
jgi:hypothetical protein